MRKIILVFMLVLVFSLVLLGCARQETEKVEQKVEQQGQPQVGGNASLANELADFLVNATSNDSSS